MRLVRTDSLIAGTKLAQSIYNENGIPLVQKGVSLTERMIQRLIKNKINYAYILDELTKGVVVEPLISNELKVEAIHNIKETFDTLQTKGPSEKSYILHTTGAKLKNILEEIIYLIKNRHSTISLLADILVTDDYTFQHSLNVAIYSLTIGIDLGFSEKELSDLGVGAIFHDIGKVFIEEEILKKKGKLTDKEFKSIQDHPKLGFDYIRKQTDLSSVIAHCAYQHHERLDGSGYPRHLKGEDIHIYAKIIAIADVFDAVTSKRTYRDAMLPHEGLEILYGGAIDKFEKNYVEAFKKNVAIYPNGLTVKLSDGREGVVAKQNMHLCDRPIIQVLKEDEADINNCYELDLSRQMDITITSCFT